jgi:enoyl-CoA hydratase
MPKAVNVGDKASRTKVFTAEDVKLFADVSLDHNPIHLDAEYAKQTIFKKPVVHGMLVASMFSGILGMDLPGEGTIAMNLSVAFKRPVFVGDEVTATVEVAAVREDKPIVTMKVYATNASGEIVIEGEGTVRV